MDAKDVANIKGKWFCTVCRAKQVSWPISTFFIAFFFLFFYSMKFLGWSVFFFLARISIPLGSTTEACLEPSFINLKGLIQFFLNFQRTSKIYSKEVCHLIGFFVLSADVSTELSFTVSSNEFGEYVDSGSFKSVRKGYVPWRKTIRHIIMF